MHCFKPLKKLQLNMKIEFINREGNDRLLLVFTGWSTQRDLYADLAPAGWDLAIVSGYSVLDFNFDLIDSYSTIYLYAYSLGVEAAEKVFTARPECITASFAINGTGLPAHDEYGIPTAIFKGTYENLSERNLRKFQRRMAGSSERFEQLKSTESETPDIEALTAELAAIFARSTSSLSESAAPSPLAPRPSSLSWNKAFVSHNDAIFPFQNQLNFWESRIQTEKITLEEPHLPDFERIIRMTIPDFERVGERFRRALNTYEKHATPQKQVCKLLTEKLIALNSEEKLPQERTILEIGAGSGCFTRMYAPVIQPLVATFVDLYDHENYEIAPVENTIKAEAERWLQSAADEAFDFILSASVMQWFVNPLRFLEDCFRTLRPGGMLACSTFAPGNLEELNVLRPSPIIYKTAEEIRQALEALFEEVEVSEHEIVMEFEDVRQLLLHLKHTGVGGNSTTSLLLTELSRTLPRNESGCYTLTYRPILIIARKPTN